MMFDWKKLWTKAPDAPAPDAAAAETERIRVATCVVLLETAEYDDDFSPVEREVIVGLLRERFDLSAPEAAELIEISARERRDSRGVRPFTHWINENASAEERTKILEAAWAVIYADDRLHSHEDHFIHRLAKLLRLDHEALISAKLKVKSGGRE